MGGSTFQGEISKRHAYRILNLRDLGFFLA
jgi:hypothetical protein